MGGMIYCKMNAEGTIAFRNRGAFTRMPGWDENQMLERLRDSDPQAVGAIYDTYSADVYRYARYRLGDSNVAEDVAGDVFVRLLEAIRNGRGPQSNIRAWLLSTADHIATDHLRRSYRRPTELMPEELIDVTAVPGEEIERRERSREFQRAYSMLTNEQQHVLALRFGQGYSLEETASTMKKKVNAIKALQFRALAALQRHIGEAPHE